MKNFKTTIKKRFRTVQRFRRLAGYDDRWVNRFRKGKLNYDELQDLQKKLNNIKDNSLTKKTVGEIRKQIFIQYGSITEFHNQHSEFKRCWLSLVLNMKLTAITKKVEKLCNTLNVNC